MSTAMSHLTWKAFGHLWHYDIFMSWKGFTEIHRSVANCPLEVRRPDPGDIERIVGAVDWAAIWHLRQVQCLQRSVVGALMLRGRGVPAELVIGVQLVPFRSHAWVEVHGVVVNDKPRVQQEYAVLERC